MLGLVKPKLVHPDAPLFMGLLSDLFPGLEVPPALRAASCRVERTSMVRWTCSERARTSAWYSSSQAPGPYREWYLVSISL